MSALGTGGQRPVRPVSHYSTNPSHAPASRGDSARLIGCWNADYANPL